MTGPGAPRGGYDPAVGDEPYVRGAQVRPAVGSTGPVYPPGAVPPGAAQPGAIQPGATQPGAVPGYPADGYGLVPGAAGAPPGQPAVVGRVSRGSIRYDLDADDESLRYVEGRPGRQLAEDLAEQRRQELPSVKEVEQAADARRRVMPLWQELPLLLIVSFCVAVLVRTFLVQAFVIPSSSMEQTLLIGDRVLVSKVVYATREPRRGEVIVFRGTDRWVPQVYDEDSGGVLSRVGDTLGDLVGVSRPGTKDFIKRVIGLPGDRVACCDELGRVTVNGVGLDEPYLSSNNPLEVTPVPGLCGARRFAEVVVPPGELFVMGDNRAVSQDSRCQGTVPIENVIGRAFFRVWPPSRWAGIGVPDTFDRVPPPSSVGGPAPQ
jgi:signal peptidase I